MKDIEDQILMHFLIKLATRSYKFSQFCNEAHKKGTNEPYFGEPGSKRRRTAQYRLKELRTRIKARTIQISDNFNFDVSCCVYSIGDCCMTPHRLIVI